MIRQFLSLRKIHYTFFLMPKNILITGSKGFIGKALLQKFQCQFPDYVTFGLDIDDGDIVTISPGFNKIDHVIHLAARIFIPDSWEEPLNFYRTNVLGTNNILEYCRKLKAPLTYISAYVYGDPEMLPIPENHPLKPNSPYMHSKVLAESLCKFYSEYYNLSITVLRPFNLYGPNQAVHFLIPHIIKQLLNKKLNSITVKDIRPKRDYLYIDDLLDAIILSINPIKKFEFYNVGYGQSYSIMEIIRYLMEITGHHKEVISENKIRKNEILDVTADIKKIKDDLSWEPKTSLKEGLKKTVESFTAYEL